MGTLKVDKNVSVLLRRSCGLKVKTLHPTSVFKCLYYFITLFIQLDNDETYYTVIKKYIEWINVTKPLITLETPKSSGKPSQQHFPRRTRSLTSGCGWSRAFALDHDHTVCDIFSSHLSKKMFTPYNAQSSLPLDSVWLFKI